MSTQPTTNKTEQLTTRETANSIEIQTADEVIVADLINSDDCCVTESMRHYASLFAAAPDMLSALKAFNLFSAMIGKDGRPSWFKDDGAWTEFVIADEYRKAAIAKAEGRQ
jgi:hypothetical protein